MKAFFALASFMLLLLCTQNASAQEERAVAGFVGNSVKVFDESMKPSGQFTPSELAVVKTAVRKGSTPFYNIEFGEKTYLVLGSKITFEDRPRTDMVPCNNRQGDFEAATFNSTMGSGEQKSCSSVD